MLTEVVELPADSAVVPGRLLVHDAHAIGHAAVLVADSRVLIAGDMLSDVLIPLLDPRRPGRLEAYDSALDLLGSVLDEVDVVVPGHGSVAHDSEDVARLEADRAYLDDLRNGREPDDARLREHECLDGPHRSHVELAHRTA